MITEKELVAGFMKKVDDITGKNAAFVNDPETVRKMAVHIVEELGNHYQNAEKIILGRISRGWGKDEAFGDYDEFERRVKETYGNRVSVVMGKAKPASYDFVEDFFILDFKSLPVEFLWLPLYSAHEKRHQKQNMKYGHDAYKMTAFLEADAVNSEIDEISKSPVGSREAVSKYLWSFGIGKGSSIIAKECQKDSESHMEYFKYVLAPAVYLEMKGQGKTEEDIFAYFSSVSDKFGYTKAHPTHSVKTLLEGLP